MNRQNHDVDPIVPEMPTDETPTLATDGGARGHTRAFDRPPRTDHSPGDRCREEIEPMVPDLR